MPFEKFWKINNCITETFISENHCQWTNKGNYEFWSVNRDGFLRKYEIIHSSSTPPKTPSAESGRTKQQYTKEFMLHNNNIHTYIRLTALVQDYPGEPYQKGKTNLDFTGARDSGWQWHQIGRMQVCTSLQTDNHTSTHHSVFTGRMPFLPPNQQRQST